MKENERGGEKMFIKFKNCFVEKVNGKRVKYLVYKGGRIYAVVTNQELTEEKEYPVRQITISGDRCLIVLDE